MKVSAEKSGRQKTLRRAGLVLWGLIFLYVASYCLLSLCGNYAGYLSRSGKLRFEFGMGLSDVRIWEPFHIVKTENSYNFLGALFSPLVELDRKFWHKSLVEVDAEMNSPANRDTQDAKKE